MTGGQFKRRHVLVPGGARPTLSKVRESVFNVLMSEFLDFSALRFLDMFSGSGIMALEAASRGFEVSAYEKNFKASRFIKKLFLDFKVNAKIVLTDALLALGKEEPVFDVIYIDPPWEFEYEPIVRLALSKINKKGIVIVEYDKRKPDLNCELIGQFPYKQKTYGRTNLSFFRGVRA